MRGVDCVTRSTSCLFWIYIRGHLIVQIWFYESISHPDIMTSNCSLANNRPMSEIGFGFVLGILGCTAVNVTLHCYWLIILCYIFSEAT